MTVRTLLSRIAAIGILIIGASIAVIAINSGEQMAGQDSIETVDDPAVEIEELPLLTRVFDDTRLIGIFTEDGPFAITGQVVVFTNDLGQRTLRLQADFLTTRGPEQVVILRSESGQVVNLGQLQSIGGTQDYAIPGQLDLAEFNEVQIWDEQLNVAFGSASLLVSNR